MDRPNFYSDNCITCGTYVPANAGVAFPPPSGGSKWVVKCKKCGGVVEGAKPKIQVTREGKDIIFKPTSFLGGDLFSAYRKATNGAKFDPVRKSQVTDLAHSVLIVQRLHEAGFSLELPQELVESLQNQTASLRAVVEEAGKRADKVDAALHERGLALFPFQRVGVQWLASRYSALLADDMGLGKTIQALTSIPQEAPVLVVSPAVAKGVWQREASKWRPELKVTVLSGRGSFRWPESSEIVVVNYDILPGDLAKLGECHPGTVLIADEAHNLKGSKTARTKNFRAISEKISGASGRVWLLTATPLLNRPPELWNVFQAANIAREAFGSWKSFLRLFNATENRWGGFEWGQPEPEVAEAISSVSLRRTKTEVLPDLPQKMWRDVSVELDAPTKRLCQKFEEAVSKYTRFSRILELESPEEVVARLRSESVAKYGDMAAEIDKALLAFSQMNQNEFEKISATRAAIAKAKIPALLELVEDLEEQEEPVVVFSAHRAPIDFLANRPGWAVITGDTPNEERTRIENEFQAGKLKGLAGTITAMGVALTLTHASQVIFVDREWTPALNDQAEDRCCRIGQTRGVCVSTLVGNVFLDQRVNALLSAKRMIIQASVTAAADQTPSIEIPEVDVESIQKESEGEAQKLTEAQEEAKRRQEQFGNEPEKKEVSEKDRKRQLKRNRILWVAKANISERRAAKNLAEDWAAQSLVTLSNLDPDRATLKNDEGFSAFDYHKGHRLSVMVEIGLTDSEWSDAIRLCKKYHRQVGECPSVGSEPIYRRQA